MNVFWKTDDAKSAPLVWALPHTKVATGVAAWLEAEDVATAMLVPPSQGDLASILQFLRNWIVSAICYALFASGSPLRATFPAAPAPVHGAPRLFYVREALLENV